MRQDLLTDTRIVTCAEAPDLYERVPIGAEEWPKFIHHGDVTNRYWDALFEVLPEFQFALYDEASDEVVAKGQTAPVAWDRTLDGLPGGVDDVLEQALADGPSREPNTLCALVAVVRREHQGKGLSSRVIQGMAALASRHGLGELIAPVRPTMKERYPLTPMDRYIRWTRQDGLPFDPWIRVHHRLGAEILAVAPHSLVVTGAVAEWEEWTGMAFSETGDYVVPGAVQPVAIDRERDLGRYDDANVWMRHPGES